MALLSAHTHCPDPRCVQSPADTSTPDCHAPQVQKLQEQLQQVQTERDAAVIQAAAARSDAAAAQQQLQDAAQQLADARQQLADAAESRDAMQSQLHSLQAALQEMAAEKDAAFTRLGVWEGRGMCSCLLGFLRLMLGLLSRASWAQRAYEYTPVC